LYIRILIVETHKLNYFNAPDAKSIALTTNSGQHEFLAADFCPNDSQHENLGRNTPSDRQRSRKKLPLDKSRAASIAELREFSRKNAICRCTPRTFVLEFFISRKRQNSKHRSGNALRAAPRRARWTKVAADDGARLTQNRLAPLAHRG
jgi:hypothetical protein